MDWFRPVVGSIGLLALTLGLFFATPLLRPADAWLQDAGAAGVWAFTLLRVALLLAAGYVVARASGRGQPAWPVALLVAGPSLVIGGLMGIAAALRPAHLLVVLLLAAGLTGACWAGARQGEAK